MKNTLLLFSLILLSIATKAQIKYGLFPIDSSTFSLETTDSLSHNRWGKIDTTNTHLWKIGKTHKPFFASGFDSTTAIMTDTTSPYPVNANDWFVLKANHQFNFMISFWHKYQTTKGHDGGIVEFSLDSGTTWQNVKGTCNGDSSFGLGGVFTDNFYSQKDTLLTGQQAFSGTSSGWQYSRFQFFSGYPVRLTKGTSSCDFNSLYFIYIRFRFVSDSVPDTLDGWIIDNIKIRTDYYGGYVAPIGYNTLHVYPNPSAGGVFIFPELNDEKLAEIEITNALGQTLFTIPYTHKIDLSAYPPGLYLYKVRSSTEYYSGRLVVE